jgi:soluble lytic murein transglycosylase
MGRSVGWVVGLVLTAACVATGPDTATGPEAPEPLAAGLAALRGGRPDEASRLLAEARRRHPTLEDHVLHFEAEAAMRAGDPVRARATAQRLLALHPDSVWRGAAYFLAGEVARQANEPLAARDLLQAARAVLSPGTDRWARATLALAELEQEEGDQAAALELAREVRRARPRGLAARRARRLCDRLRAGGPAPVSWTRVEEAEMRLGEGDAEGARAVAEAALAAGPPADEEARALWVRAQAERALGDRGAAEATCRKLASGADPLAARALFAAAGWRWNADDDTGAIGLFETLVARFPESPQAAESLYAIGRIHQEHALRAERENADPSGSFAKARAAYAQVAERFPDAPLAPESRWRVGWIDWLAGDAAAAERAFRAAAGHGGTTRVAAEYWRARTLGRLGDAAAERDVLTHVADHHGLSYYAGLAEARLDGRAPARAPEPVVAGRASFPAELSDEHAERARLLADLRLPRLARLEVDALRSAGAPHLRVVEAYAAVGAPGAALRLAREMRPDAATHLPPDLERYLYPLGYWDAVEPAARASGLDPLLVVSVIRQESLFEPEAVSPADAHGLMQLLPRTAHDLLLGLGRPATRPNVVRALHSPATNVELGVRLLARLLDRYGGSREKALAAYNAGEDAVTKWEQRYGGRAPDEFVELISYRETRDYVRAVLRNHRIYRRLYAATPASASARSAGSPPKAPFDMTTMTSDGRAEPTR